MKKKLNSLVLENQTPKFLGDWGRCDGCNQYYARRWHFSKSSQGVVILCSTCRERVEHKTKYEALDSRARLPGSYGGGK